MVSRELADKRQQITANNSENIFELNVILFFEK